MDDSLLLTMMTMLLTILLCLKRGLSVEFTAACIIIVNIAGFILGTGGAALFGRIFSSELVVRPVSTFATTEIIGWTIVLFTKRFQTDETSRWEKSLKWLLAAYLVIFLFRFVYVELFRLCYGSPDEFMNALQKILANSPALLIFLCINIVAIRYNHRWKNTHAPVAKSAGVVALMAVISTAMAMFVGYGLPLKINSGFSFKEFCSLLMITSLIEITSYTVIYMIDYSFLVVKSRDEARNKEHLARYKYIKLKEQVNPHFLFNSLNILNGLVQEQKTGLASTYIQKLAGIYRYMINSEEETLVRLNDEIIFVEMYADLLHVRFADGFSIEYDIPEQQKIRWVAPCCVQLLIENAIKHNIVESSDPLVITIKASEDSITVTNTIRPKTAAPQSTGLGLKYIKQVYSDLSGCSVEADRTETEYSVTLPLL